MQYQNELRKIKSLVSSDTWEILQTSNAIVAGGAITSTFCNREVNDLDVYFRSEEDFCVFLDLVFDGGFHLVAAHMTSRSILFRDKRTHQDVQVIVYKFFPNELAIFADYDFTCNMGALSFGWKKKGYDSDEQFVLHSDFLRHNSQRYLEFNTGTAYPLISALRVAKYAEKGYNISKAQMLRVLLAVNAKNIDSWATLKDEVAGMYGLNMDEVFPESEEFSLDKAMEILNEIYSDDKFKENKFKEYSKNEILEAVCVENKDSREDCSKRIFKNVCKNEDGTLVSFYDDKFVYKLGEIVDGGKHGLYAEYGYAVTTACYSGEDDGVIIELIPIEGTEVKHNTYGLKDAISRINGPVKVGEVFTRLQFIKKFKKTDESDKNIPEMEIW